MELTIFKRLLKQKLLSIKPNSQYNFLTKKLYKTLDIDLINKTLSCDYFKEVLVPRPVDCDNWKRIIIFAPHQDDEVIGCGALLNRLKSQKCHIDLVFLTDGRPLGQNAANMVNKRLEESKLVAGILKANLINIGINNVSLKIDLNHVKQIEELINIDWYDAIFTPWVLDAPPKHRLCNALLSKIFKNKLHLDSQIFNYQVHNSLIPNVYLDYTSEFGDKQKLIKVYESQLKTQNYAHLSEGLDAWNARYLDWSPYKRFIEVYHQIPLKSYLELVYLYSVNVEQTFKSDPRCIEAYKTLNTIF